jgi:2',3'-cyclic-nucleotide 2'-phosphodiesterase (5'-nucleotidase family)
MNADVGYMNGGGVRADIAAGDVTFNDLLSVMPFNNTVVLAEVSGQVLKDMMEMAVMSWPAEDGSFPHLSGIQFSVNTSIPSSVVINEFEEFVGVSGQYRVYDMKIFNKDTKRYEPVDLTKKYTIAATNYYLLEYGSGMKMLENVKVLKNDGLLDVEALERYIVEDLGGVVGKKYADADVNITFTEGELLSSEDNTDESGDTNKVEEETSNFQNVTDDPVITENSNNTLLIICITCGVVIALIAILFSVRMIKKHRD